MVVAAEIFPEKFYDEFGVSQTLSLSLEQVRTECNRNRLKHVKRAGRRYFRGQWIIDWLDSGDSIDEAVANV